MFDYSNAVYGSSSAWLHEKQLTQIHRGIFTRDYLVVQGVAMAFAVSSVAVNFLADILTVAIDPRVKL